VSKKSFFLLINWGKGWEWVGEGMASHTIEAKVESEAGRGLASAAQKVPEGTTDTQSVMIILIIYLA